MSMNQHSGNTSAEQEWGAEDFGSDVFDSPLMSEINVTPLVDVMLVLLVIFMVTAPLLEQGIELKIPKATTAPLNVQQEKVVLEIDARGRIFYEKTQLKIDKLDDQIEGIFKHKKNERQVFIRADESLNYGVLAHIIAKLKRAGVQQIGLVTQKE